MLLLTNIWQSSDASSVHDLDPLPLGPIPRTIRSLWSGITSDPGSLDPPGQNRFHERRIGPGQATLGSILVLLVVRGPGNPNKEIASFPIGIFRNPLTGDPRVSASETALGSRTKDEYSSMNEDVSNPTLFGGSSGEYMDSLGSVYNSRGHCSCPHTSSQTTLGHPVLQQLLGDSAAAFEHRAQLLQQESALSH